MISKQKSLETKLTKKEKNIVDAMHNAGGATNPKAKEWYLEKETQPKKKKITKDIT